jgi:hypothetical protein
LQNRALKLAHPLKGKFRLFLLASFQNFLSDEASRARCQKRGRGREFVFLDSEDAKSRYRLEPADRLTAEKPRFEVLKVFVGVEEGRTSEMAIDATDIRKVVAAKRSAARVRIRQTSSRRSTRYATHWLLPRAGYESRSRRSNR